MAGVLTEQPYFFEATFEWLFLYMLDLLFNLV